MSEELKQLLQSIKSELHKITGVPAKTHLKTDEACTFLSCSPNTLTAICIQYNIIPIKIGGVNYYSVKDLNSIFTA